MDDNGSGTAAVVEIARILSTHRLERTVRFLLFGNEEVGLVGSQAYVEQMTDAEMPAFFVNFDMIGFTSPQADSLSSILGQAQGDWIGAYAPDWAADAMATFDAAARAFAPECRFVALSIPQDHRDEPFLSEIDASDHSRFWAVGIPGILLGEPWFFGQVRNTNIHGPDDTLETLDLAFMAQVVKAGLAVVCVKAGLLP